MIYLRNVRVLARLAWNAFAPRLGRISYRLGRWVHSGSTSPRCEVRWRTESVPRSLRQSILLRRSGYRHRGACVTRRRPVFLFSFFFAPPDHDLRDILFIHIFGFPSIERPEITGRRSYSNESVPTTQSYSCRHVKMTCEALIMTRSSGTVVW